MKKLELKTDLETLIRLRESLVREEAYQLYTKVELGRQLAHDINDIDKLIIDNKEAGPDGNKTND